MDKGRVTVKKIIAVLAAMAALAGLAACGPSTSEPDYGDILIRLQINASTQQLETMAVEVRYYWLNSAGDVIIAPPVRKFGPNIDKGTVPQNFRSGLFTDRIEHLRGPVAFRVDFKVTSPPKLDPGLFSLGCRLWIVHADPKVQDKHDQQESELGFKDAECNINGINYAK